MPARKSEPSEGLRSRLKNLFRWANVLLIALTLLIYAVPFTPASFWPLSLIAPFYPLALLLNILFALWWILWRKKYAWLSLLCILLGWNYLQSYFGFHFLARPSTTDLQVMTFNLHDLKDLPFRKGHAGHDLTGLLNFLDEIGKPQVLCLQEIHQGPAAELAEAIGYQHLHYPEKGTAILSALPFQASGYIAFPHSGNSALWADIKWKGQTLRIFNLHLQSNRISTQTEKLSNQREFDEKVFRQIRSILRNYKRAAQQRIQQVEIIRKEMEKTAQPYIVCGDFNDTPLSHTYHQLSEGLLDAFRQKGAGPGTTYARFPPALRIDYILHTPDLQASACKIYRQKFSDHYPVSTHFK